jgi:cobaltochelatase CobS
MTNPVELGPVNNEKRLAARKALGDRRATRITSENRTHAKRWLVGLGFNGTEVSTFKLETLQQAFASTSYLTSMFTKRGGDAATLQAILDSDERAIAAGWTPSTTQDDNEDDDAPKAEPKAERTRGTRAQATLLDDLDSLDEDEAALIRKLREKRKAAMDEDRVIELIREHSATPPTVRLEITTPTKTTKTEGAMHHAFPALLAAVGAGVNVMLVGPAGSGKTTAAEKVAEALDLPFYFTGAVDSPYKLTGFVDAQGRVVETAFLKAYRDGGVFLFDEMDASLPGAVLAFNAALANGQADFPGGMVPRHENFRCIAATNTFGRGADRQYVGRTQQDAAALDRYATLAWDYDPALEAAMVGLPRPQGAPEPIKITPKAEGDYPRTASAWFDRVQRVRKAIEDQKVRHVVSPRATVAGVRLLMAGWPQALTEEATIWKGLEADARAKVEAAAR